MGQYTLIGNDIHLHFSDNISKESVMVNLQQIKSIPTQIDQFATYPNTDYSKSKIKESENKQQQINSLLEEVFKIEKKEGILIQEIRVEDMQISKNELSVKESFLKAMNIFTIRNMMKP